jgi:hypothetical protein
MKPIPFPFVKEDDLVKPMLSWPGASALLLATLLSAAGGRRCAADTPPLPEAPDLRLVPADTAGFATVRVAALAGKLGLKETSEVPVLAACAKALGVKIADVERLTLIFLPGRCTDPVGVLRTSKPCDREQVAHAVKDADLVVHFVDDRLFLVGPEDLVKRLSDKPGPNPAAADLREAARHDLFAVLPSGSPIAGYFDFPFTLPGLATTEAVLDVGDQLVLRLHFNYADEAAARRGAKWLGVFASQARALLLGLSTELAVLNPALGQNDESLAADPRGKILQALVPVLGKLEKSLGQARIEADKKTVPLTLTVPVDPKEVPAALRALCVLGGLDRDSPGWGKSLRSCPPFPGQRPEISTLTPAATPLPGTGPAPAAPVRTLSWGGIRGESLLPGTGPAQAAPVLYTGSGCPPAGSASPFPNKAPMPALPISNWAPGVSPGPVGYTGTVPPPVLQTGGVCTPVATRDLGALTPAKEVKLTVANVTKEEALLFSEGDNGKFVFSQKVPAGEAVDVKTAPGKRWSAVWGTETVFPHGATFRVPNNATTDDIPWLLRPDTRQAPPLLPLR